MHLRKKSKRMNECWMVFAIVGVPGEETERMTREIVDKRGQCTRSSPLFCRKKVMFLYSRYCWPRGFAWVQKAYFGRHEWGSKHGVVRAMGEPGAQSDFQIRKPGARLRFHDCRFSFAWI
jgi:hypothetical protein